MNEHRQSKREAGAGITAFIHRPDGSVHEGVVQDVSDGGAKIAGNPAGLKVGDRLDVVAVVQGERVRFACEVKYLEPAAGSLGVQFHSRPQKVADDSGTARRCMQCRRDYSMECNYCSHCGQKLIRR